MTFASSLQQLSTQQTLLDEAFAALQVTLCEDRPAATAPALLDRFENIITDLRGCGTELAEALSQLQSRNRFSVDAEQMKGIHEIILRIERCYWQDLACYAALGELMRMGQQRGRGWQVWSQVVLAATQACSHPLSSMHVALIDCWCALAERRPALATVTNLPKLQTNRSSESQSVEERT